MLSLKMHVVAAAICMLPLLMQQAAGDMMNLRMPRAAFHAEHGQDK